MLQKSLKFAFISICLCGTAASADYRPVTAPGSNATPALLTAGMFRLESERSYKLSLQMALGILSGHTEVERSRSFETIARLRKDLSRQMKTEKSGKAFNRVNLALNDQVESLPKLNAKTAAAMYDVNEDLLIKMNFLSFAIESETNDTTSRITGLALRQASLAQRMAKIVLLRSMDKNMQAKQGLQVDLAQSRIEFVNGMNLLADEAQDDKALKSRLNLAQQQWMFYEKALSATALRAEDLRNISSTSDRIAQMMVEIVRLGYGLPPDPSIIAER
ncbi:hypothetical protein [Undibacterium flavidum]|uniref:PilJ/NarX-like methyl-accepting chemotaxis transducer n=1 Tax=Undibacterium flavidum TaxID=2762297 RepID=A0ABR6YC00_9BURK|nr:hypothetical protein [Undibacterium flavidum]MBC3873909.1 hypothetical protein [Undibacterium flavidum]